MTTAAPVPKTIIKICPDSIAYFKSNPGTIPATTAAPAGYPYAWRSLWFLSLLACLLLFWLKLNLLSGICAVLALTCLLKDASLRKRQREPQDQFNAYFDDEGLHLLTTPAKAPAESRADFIPYEDMTQIVTLDVPIPRKRTLDWRRKYQVHTTRAGDNPYVEMTTMRSMETVISILNRLKRLPAARHIQIPDPTEVPPPLTDKAGKKR